VRRDRDFHRDRDVFVREIPGCRVVYHR
jgi:hypothetical protein